MPSLVLAIQHSADDPPGRLGDWMESAGCELVVTRCFLGEPLPDSLARFAGLVVLGGAMGAYDDATAAWLTPTKMLLREAVRTEVTTLAVCLGHQLLAVACSGRVATAATPQVGLQRIGLSAAAADDHLFSAVPDQAQAVHWNNDLVTQPPPGALVLSRSSSGLQAYRVGRRAWGVQFHPEVDVETVRGWAAEDVRTGALSPARASSLVAEIAAADADLDAVWSSFGQRFAELVLAAED